MKQCISFALVMGLAFSVDSLAAWSLVGLCVVGVVVLGAATLLVIK